ncbi:10346_t:CDS:1 [Acaulospora morrowiae]|uniref:10346_t:CDS:1 n=1 Tax=Acaulospora morrowiae TaxID=94023 RepID=A0A9N8V9H7_9GLOM|nr:10346_t:CDS:1 [Acaulospora morrowiae]
MARFNETITEDTRSTLSLRTPQYSHHFINNGTRSSLSRMDSQVAETVQPSSSSSASDSTPQTSPMSRNFHARMERSQIQANPLLKSLYDQVDVILHDPSIVKNDRDIIKIFHTVMAAIEKNLADPESLLYKSPTNNRLGQLFGLPENGNGISITLNLMRPKIHESMETERTSQLTESQTAQSQKSSTLIEYGVGATSHYSKFPRNTTCQSGSHVYTSCQQ